MKKTIPKKGSASLRSKSMAKDKKTSKKGAMHVVVVGASAGGSDAIEKLVSPLSPKINAAVLIVLHLPKAARGEVLASRIQRHTELPCRAARHEEPIRAGHIYIAPADSHLLVKEGKMLLGHGVAENRFRPSIDVLFRSAAVAYGQATIGIILTGLLHDGTAGMQAIKECGGYCLVQDPEEAQYPDMPLSVLETIRIDHCGPAAAMSDEIEKVIRKNKPKKTDPPPKILVESKIAEKAATGIDNLNGQGERTPYSCPDCGGSLWQVSAGKVERYRCHIGHAYSQSDLLLRQAESIENTLWVAVRMMEERKFFFDKLSRESRTKHLQQLSETYQQHADHLDEHIQKLKNLLVFINRD